MPSSPPSFLRSTASLLVLSARHGTAGHVEPVLVQGDGWGCATEIARLTQDRQSRSAFHRQRVGWSGVAAAPTLSFALVAASARSTGNPRENRTDLQASEPHPGWFPRGPQRPPRLGKGKRGKYAPQTLTTPHPRAPDCLEKSGKSSRAGCHWRQPGPPDRPPPSASGAWKHSGEGTSLEPRDDPSCRARC